MFKKCVQFGPHHGLHVNGVCAAVVLEKTFENRIAIIGHQISTLKYHYAAAVDVGQ
jgi:hypothetical protein